VEFEERVGLPRAAGAQLSEDEPRSKGVFPHEPVTLVAGTWAPAKIAREVRGQSIVGGDRGVGTSRATPSLVSESRRSGSP
jgi:hypothetical protein